MIIFLNVSLRELEWLLSGIFERQSLQSVFFLMVCLLARFLVVVQSDELETITSTNFLPTNELSSGPSSVITQITTTSTPLTSPLTNTTLSETIEQATATVSILETSISTTLAPPITSPPTPITPLVAATSTSSSSIPPSTTPLSPPPTISSAIPPFTTLTPQTNSSPTLPFITPFTPSTISTSSFTITLTTTPIPPTTTPTPLTTISTPPTTTLTPPTTTPTTPTTTTPTPPTTTPTTPTTTTPTTPTTSPTPPTTQHPQLSCHIFSDRGTQTADCSYRNMVINVPNTLNPKIQALNLSGNTIVNINSKSFDRYKDSLTTLDLSKLTRSADFETFSGDSFVSLQNLQYLDISESCQEDSNFQFPGSLKTLKMNHCKMSSVPDLSNVESLSEFHAENTGITTFPTFHPNAPLTYLDLRQNDLTNIQATNLAPYCQLNKIDFEFDNSRSTLLNTAYCYCTELEDWLTELEIEHQKLNCQFGANEPECIETKSKERKEKLQQQRKECLDRIEEGTVMNWLPILLPLLLVPLCCALPSFLFMRRKFARDRYDNDVERGGRMRRRRGRRRIRDRRRRYDYDDDCCNDYDNDCCDDYDEEDDCLYNSYLFHRGIKMKYSN